LVRYLDKKSMVRAELIKCACAGKSASYGDFGARVGIPPQGPWKPLLDQISQEETASGRPDITFLLINKRTRFPGQIGFVRANKPSPDQIRLARRELRAVFDKYCPDAPMPF
jgi:hypothetical protein